MGNITGSKRGKYILKVVNKGYFKNQGKNIKRDCLVCSTSFNFYISLRDRKYCSRVCYQKSQKGTKRPEHSEKMKGRVSKLKGRKTPSEVREKLSGKNSPRWRGGITTLYHKIRRLPEYNEWRSSVFKRDNFKCTNCLLSGIRLEADHIKQFFIIIKENKITNYQEALKCKELWDINNGRTLCKECHKQTETYGKNTYTPPIN